MRRQSCRAAVCIFRSLAVETFRGLEEIRLSFKIAPVQVTNLTRQMTVMRSVGRGIIGISSKDGRVVW